MLTAPVIKATSTAYWVDFGLRSARDETFYHPTGFKFSEHVQVRLGLDHDDCISAMEMQLARCLVDHPVLASWGSQLVGATLVELRDPAFQPLAEQLKKNPGPWLAEPRLQLDGFDSELIIERQEGGWVKLSVCLTEYVGCACGLYNPVASRRCSRCKATVGRKPAPAAASSSGGGWWPFKKKS